MAITGIIKTLCPGPAAGKFRMIDAFDRGHVSAVFMNPEIHRLGPRDGDTGKRRDITKWERHLGFDSDGQVIMVIVCEL